MEIRISQKLPEVLLDKSIEYHTRRGLRLGCDCEYCRVKQNGTTSIAHTGTWMQYGKPNLLSDHDSWEIWAVIQKSRKEQAKELRTKLNELKLEL